VNSWWFVTTTHNPPSHELDTHQQLPRITPHHTAFAFAGLVPAAQIAARSEAEIATRSEAESPTTKRTGSWQI